MNNMCADDYLKVYDYKSIALPAELQGHLISCLIFIRKAQLNQCIKKISTMLAAVAARSISASCRQLVTNLSVWSRYGFPISVGNVFRCFHPLKINQLMEWKTYEQKYKIYKSNIRKS